MVRRTHVSPDRILAAAAIEFADRGFAGARVDRIARRAQVNKAMLYYHFDSKAGLYRTLLRRLFALAGERLRRIADSDAPPARKLDDVVAVMAGMLTEHRYMPAIMLREMAEGGQRLDRTTLKAMTALPGVVASIVQQGVAAGAFRSVDPFFAYFSMLAPLVLFRASGPVRAEVTDLRLLDLSTLTPDQFVQQLQESLRRSLAPDGAGSARPPR
jgi:TetR/AcrR family transcriptional regulator